MSTEHSNTHQQTFDRIEESYLASWCRFHPESALDAGIEDYADQLTPHSDESIGIQIVLNEKCLAALDELDNDQLDPTRQTNFKILHAQASLEHHSLMEHDWRHRDPSRFLPINALYQLTLRPINNFEQALKQRLAAIPSHIRDAKNYLSSAAELIPPLWLDMAIAETKAGIEFLHQLHLNPQISLAMNNDESIEQSLADAATSLESFSLTLQRLSSKSAGDFAVGKQQFERLLKQQHFLPINSHVLYDFGQALFDKTSQQLELAIADSELSLAEIQQHHPSSADLLSQYQIEMQAAEDFVREKDLISFTATQQLNIVSTPDFLQYSIPFAAYHEPSIADVEQRSYYYVTPPKTDDELGEHNFASISQTSIHEAWPGHHLQFVTANQSADGSSLLRRLNPCATLYEGWALYCEQMMLEQGFERHKGQYIIMLRDRLWRALRIMIDVDIHCRQLPIEDAAQKMVDALGFSFEQAMGECRWYSQSPTVPMSYAVGWALINALRDIINPSTRQELKSFHDQLLASGSIALPLVIQTQFGDDIWQKCCHRVFGEQK